MTLPSGISTVTCSPRTASLCELALRSTVTISCVEVVVRIALALAAPLLEEPPAEPADEEPALEAPLDPALDPALDVPPRLLDEPPPRELLAVDPPVPERLEELFPDEAWDLTRMHLATVPGLIFAVAVMVGAAHVIADPSRGYGLVVTVVGGGGAVALYALCARSLHVAEFGFLTKTIASRSGRQSGRH